MSVVPTSTLPRCTRTIVLDVLFMRKYSLSYTQLSVLYYLLMLKNWVTFKEDNFYVILSKKIEDDLYFHPKTVEASITKLKKLQLIEIKRVKVETWNKNRTYRAIAITPLGKEYNLSYYKESDYQHAVELEKENEEYRVENDEVHSENMDLVVKNSDLEFKNKSLTLQSTFAIKALESEASVPKKTEIKKSEAKAVVSESKLPQKKKEKDLDSFRKKVIKEYARSGKALCNAVANQDGWRVKTKFYINSFSRLSIYDLNGKLKQIADPKQIDNFWKWLFYHQNRVGKILDHEKKADISTLLDFLGKEMSMNNQRYTIKSLTPLVGGVKLVLCNSNEELIIASNGCGSKMLDVDKCREMFEVYVCDSL